MTGTRLWDDIEAGVLSLGRGSVYGGCCAELAPATTPRTYFSRTLHYTSKHPSRESSHHNAGTTKYIVSARQLHPVEDPELCAQRPRPGRRDHGDRPRCQYVPNY